jgi:hypothetical protein
MRRNRKAILALAVTLALVVPYVGYKGYRIRKARQAAAHHQATAPAAAEPVSPKTIVPTPAVAATPVVRDVVRAEAPAVAPANPAFDTFAGYLAECRKQLRFALDIPPADWAPSQLIDFKDLGPLPFSADDMPRPSAAERAEAKTKYPLVRPAPYPYYRMLSIPSDCCATHFSDVFYTHTLLSRRFGLDTGSSFFPFSATGAGPAETGSIIALFCKGQPEPRVTPVRIEKEDIDALPLFLCYFYRGWVDHIHSWSSEATPAVSLVARTRHTLSADGEEKIDLRLQGHVATTFQGLQASMAVSEGVTSFELTLVDRGDLAHHIVYKTPLGDRQGWNVSALPPDELQSVNLKLIRETNRKPLHILGRPAPDGVTLKAATLKVQGKRGATVEIKALRAFDLTRTMIESQMAQLRQYNILPNTSTNHGGYSSWAGLQTMPTIAMQGQSVPRPPLGGRLGSPAYHADLLRRLGVEFLVGLKIWPGQRLYTLETADGTAWYGADRQDVEIEECPLPAPSGQMAHFENLGRLVAGYLGAAPAFGAAGSLYTHYNTYNGEAFATVFPGVVQMSALKKLHPHAEAALTILANTRYNLDGRCAEHQRVWTCPISVQMRYLQLRQALTEHARLDGNTVRITPWNDKVIGRTVPDAAFLTQDLHGQTFYVPEARTARVFVGDVELKALQRNPADSTGRPSVTIVDTTTPTVVFDEVDLLEQTGRTMPEGASLYFRHAGYRGDYALEVRAEKAGDCRVRWEPFLLSSHENEFIRFAYKKTNPQAKIVLSWTLTDGTETVATEGDLHGRQGWQLPDAEGTDYHEVVLSFADMRAPASGKKRLPRGEVQSIRIGLQNAAVGDAVFFDRVEFLAARGVRPHAGQGMVVGGRLYPPRDGETITLTRDGQMQRTATSRGGWFLFTGVPPESIVEIAFESNGTRYYPSRGRLTQVTRNDLELHIHAHDPRSPLLPRPQGYVGLPVTDATAPKENGSGKQRQELEAIYLPHAYRFYAGSVGNKRSYMIEEHANNFGFVDRDRRFDNPDRAVRIFLQGDCWTEGLQTLTHQHINTLLESRLRRRSGVPVEVIVSATSSSSPASYSLGFEKYGSRFHPDLVLMFVSPSNMAHLEPTLLRGMIGWDKQHAPYKMYDFDRHGNLVAYPPDPENYGAYMTPPDNRPLVGAVPLVTTFAAAEADHPAIDRGFDLLRGILREQYQARLKGQGAVGMIYGHENLAPTYGVRHGGVAVADEVWRSAVREVCRDVGVIGLDLAPYLPKSRFGEMCWEYDGHLTATANDRLAAALAEEIAKLPEFQRVVEQRRQR